MEMKRVLIISSFIITLFLLITIFLVGTILNEKREKDVNVQFEKLSKDFNNMQLLYMISQSYDNKMVCLAFKSKLKEMDYYIWKLGDKLDKYRVATEEFTKSQFYLTQKKRFNENELYYYLLLKSVIERCNLHKSIILFFYQNSKTCKKCDDQSFVLRDIRDFDEKENKEVAIFSFDMDLGLSPLHLLSEYYNIDRYPCIVVDDKKHCGIKSKDEIMHYICDNNTNLTLCNNYFKED
jgi:hypothetical protein